MATCSKCGARIGEFDPYRLRGSALICIDCNFLCVDCGKSTLGGEYYGVHDALWKQAGMEPNGGMLCLACLERRIGRPLTLEDFRCTLPSLEVWSRHVAPRGVPYRVAMMELHDAQVHDTRRSYDTGVENSSVNDRREPREARGPRDDSGGF